MQLIAFERPDSLQRSLGWLMGGLVVWLVGRIWVDCGLASYLACLLAGLLVGWWVRW